MTAPDTRQPSSPALFTRLGPADTAAQNDGVLLETFRANASTASAWGPMQHGGPVAALLARAMDHVSAADHSRITQLSVDILGPVPIDEVRVRAAVVRPGRRITLVEATTEARTADGSWRPVARGSAWRLATQPTEDVVWQPEPALPPSTGNGQRGLGWMGFPDAWASEGFVDSVTWEIVEKGGGPGQPTQAWIDLVVPLVEGEETTGLERVVAVADTVNGVGARLDPSRFTFLNTELTIHLFDVPRTGLVGISAENVTGPDGVGMSTGTLHHEHGCIGRVTQNVLVERRA